jgi:hypothetical protein
VFVGVGVAVVPGGNSSPHIVKLVARREKSTSATQVLRSKSARASKPVSPVQRLKLVARIEKSTSATQLLSSASPSNRVPKFTTFVPVDKLTGTHFRSVWLCLTQAVYMPGPKPEQVNAPEVSVVGEQPTSESVPSGRRVTVSGTLQVESGGVGRPCRVTLPSRVASPGVAVGVTAGAPP